MAKLEVTANAAVCLPAHYATFSVFSSDCHDTSGVQG